MKMFKKLMAVALAGVMALAVLTGCGTSVNAKILETDVKDDSTLNSQRVAKADEIKKAVAGDDTTNQYLVGYAPKVKYDSKLYNTLDSGIDALAIFLNSDTFNPVKRSTEYEAIDGAVSLIGFADTTINGTTYTVAVIKTPTQKVNH